MSQGTDIPGTGRGGNYQFCLECGAPNFPGSARCFLCGQDLKAIRQGVKPPPLPPTRGPMTYSLSTLFLIVTVAGICFGLIAIAPGLGIPIAVLLVPALFRTFEISSYRRARGERLTWEDKIGSFLATLVGILLLIVAGLAALFAVCASITDANAGRNQQVDAIVVYVGAAAGVAFLAGIWFYKRGSDRGS
jgi:hypothetical protein